MLRLPSLTAGSAEWRLPLNEEAANRLLACLLAPSSRRRLESFAQTLKTWPPFLVWTVCRHAAVSAEPPETIGELARRFLPRLLDELNWPESGRAANRLLSSSEKRWQVLAERSIRVAEISASLAASQVPADRSRRHIGQVFMVGLLHTACDWLSSCGPAVRITKSAVRLSPLPAWLLEWLRQIGEDPVAGPTSIVSSAIAQYAERHDERMAAGASSRVVVDDVADGRSAQVGQLLPLVAAKLRRLERLELDFQATLEQEKIESLRQFAYGASHEINNPLANISTRAQTLLREETNPEKRKRLATINAQAFRAHEMISDMMLFAKPPGLSIERVELSELIGGLLKELQLQADQQGTSLRARFPQPPVVIEADRVQLAVAVRAVCVNSLEAIGGGGSVDIRVTRTDPNEGGEWVEIAVRDTGPGIPPEIRRHLFDPFFSGREAGRGLGFGLSKCWRIVTMHGGRIEVESQSGQGALVRLLLPLAHAACARSSQ